VSERVTEPETVKAFLQNHFWLDIVDQIESTIEGLRNDLEQSHVYDETGKAVSERTQSDDILIRGQIKGLRDVLILPHVILDDLMIGGSGANTEEDQDDAND